MRGGFDAPQLAAGLMRGERRSLARAITLVESSRVDHREQALALLAAIEPPDTPVLRLGISGVPGAGKSTFIEVLGIRLIERGHRVAVLTVDPSSAISGGAILGDKTRMPRLSRAPEAFIRPSPAGTTLGGVARRTRETMALVEAAGYDRVIVETVGVGQSETTAASMTDLFALLLAPAAGDDLQGIKRGIVELADLVVITKADGDTRIAAARAASDYSNALRLLRPRRPHWRPTVSTCSALHDEGVCDILASIETFYSQGIADGDLLESRRKQARHWLWQETTATLVDALRADASVGAMLQSLESQVEQGTLLPGLAADRLVEAFMNRRTHSS
jgi:LAO/AO transport system kinase